MKTLNLTNPNCEDKSCQIVTSSIEKRMKWKLICIIPLYCKKGSKNTLLWKSIWSMNIVLFIDKKNETSKDYYFTKLVNTRKSVYRSIDAITIVYVYSFVSSYQSHTFWNKVPPNIRSIITLNNFPLQIHIHYRSDAT